MPTMQRPPSVWSLRYNLRCLFVCPTHHVCAVDGLRALSILGILMCHTIFFWDFLLPKETYQSMLSHAIPRLMLFGELSVDLFFVISGFLIARILFEDYDTHNTLHIKNFYTRRFMRLLPAYLVTLLLFCVWIQYNCHMSWTNILYINNFIPLKHQCMASGWSLAIEEQFYSIFPWFLLLFMGLFRRHIGVLFGLLILAFLIRLYVMWSSGLPVPMLFSMKNPDFITYFDILYDKPHTRYASLLCGVMLAYSLRYTKTLEYLQRFGILGTLALCVGLGMCVSVLLVSRHHISSQSANIWGIMYMASHRIIFAIGAALCLLSTHAPHGPGSWLNRFLSMPFWYPIAQLSYAAYLLHPIVIDRLYHLLPHRAYSTSELLLLFCLNTTLSLFAASLMYVFIERPFMRLRPAAPRVKENV